jgi:predicted metalloprotease
MRWRTGRRSENIEDRRGRSGRPRGRGIRLGGGMGLLIVIVLLLLGQNPLGILGGAGEPRAPAPAPPVDSGAVRDQEADFISVVLADTEDTWQSLFDAAGRRYQPPQLILYDGMVQSACGFGSAAAGPFYCPGDRKVYIDLAFFRELSRLGAEGDFARAYVLGHEVAHHVQNLMGTMDEVNRLRSRVGRADADALSVLTELQADCYAGVWAHHAHRQRNILERGDIDEGLAAAAAVGDDRLQRMAGRGVHPESFTHGSSRQRAHWFRTGLQSGSIAACDTFGQSVRS